MNDRPKIVSIPTSLQGLDIASKIDILWPCKAFSITLPCKKKNALNIFEETVLKITQLEGGNTEQISSFLYLEYDLIAFIQNRLFQLDLLDNKYELSQAGEQLISAWDNKKFEEYEPEVVTIFVDLCEGRVLPFIYSQELQYEKMSVVDKDYVVFECGSKGKTVEIKARKVIENQSKLKYIPSVRDIHKAIRLYNKRIMQYKPFSTIENLAVNESKTITVGNEGECIYLHAQVVIQNGNSGEYIVSDGCGLGFSENFRKYLINNCSWLIKTREKTASHQFAVPSDRQEGTQWKYPEVTKSIKKAYINLKTDASVKTNNEAKDSKNKSNEIIRNLYLAIESTFAELYLRYPSEHWFYLFSNQDKNTNIKIVIAFAKKIGFIINNKNSFVISVKSGALKKLINNISGDFQNLFALVLANANDNANNPLHNLAKEFSDFISFIADLKKKRDSIEHGKFPSVSISDLENYYYIVRTVVKVLIPDIYKDLQFDRKNEKPYNRVINQDIANARLAVEKKLGTSMVYQLQNNVSELLEYSEILLNNYEYDKNIEIIKTYASLLQILLLEAVKEHTKIEMTETSKESIEVKMKLFGFLSSSEELPVELSTVKDKLFVNALHLKSTSLGAQLLAYFYLEDDENLQKLKIKYSDFVFFVSKLIQYRGHGNQNIDLSFEQLHAIREDMYKIIKFFCGEI